MTAGAPRAGLPTKVAYGFGSVAYGVKDNGFAYFLLFFYSQVLGVPPALASAAIFIALIVDAFSDPLVGYISDNLHSRWGRRHPFMYASAVPVALCFYFLWNPPAELTGAELFPYLLVVAILMRISITIYEVPSTALVAELTDDYDQRTSFLSFRYFFGWWGGLTIAVIMYLLLLQESAPGAGDGFFHKPGYETYGLIGAIMMFVSIMISALGTHRQIPNLKPPPPPQKFSLQRMLNEMVETFSNPSFHAIFGAALIFGMVQGVVTSLSNYFYNFFWELTNIQVGIITTSIFFSAGFALIAAPIVSKRIGKKRGALIIGFLAFTLSPLPYILKLIGWFPEVGTQALFITLFIYLMVDVGLIIMTQILISSMIADIVEDSELQTGRRSEGSFFAAQTFARKSVNGFGVLAAGAILALVNFPVEAKPGAVEPEIIRNFALVYVPVVWLLYMAGMWVLSFYRIDRQQHLDNLEKLGAKAALKADGGTKPPAE